MALMVWLPVQPALEKVSLLQTLIASLSINYSPEEVAFVLIDYKGGGMANVFKDLPHQIGIITNLEGNQSIRALAAIKSELKRRQRMLDSVGVNHIDNYQRLRRTNPALEALPHLIIISDEFAELVQTQPEFMKELIKCSSCWKKPWRPFDTGYSENRQAS